MAIFENPNDPAQPKEGVYGWYAIKNGQDTAIYVGMAGKKNAYIPKGTLFRGVSELQRNTFTSNAPRYDKLDIDFIVGTAIIYFEKHGYSCVWRHICNDPTREREYVNKQKPLLQDHRNANIISEYRIKKEADGYWKHKKSPLGVKEAEDEIFSILKKYIA